MAERGRIKAVPLSIQDAKAYVEANHRHHKAAAGDKYRIGAAINGELVGVVQVGRPVSRMLDDGKTLEVIRLCTTGDKDVCSFLYSRAARVAKELGYSKIITYILDTEPGTSLKASGWHCEQADVGGGSWHRQSRPRTMKEEQISLLSEANREKYPIGEKQRWARILNEE